MMMKQDSTTTATATAIACGNCGVEERRLLHHVRHRAIFRRLCTTCVLRLHPQSFCPTCFLVYDRSPPLPSNDAVTCFKCYSSSHSRCVGSTSSSPYTCPLCTNPNLPIFTLKKSNNGELEGENEIDKRAARVLLAAARISAVSMSKAAVAARAEAERRAKEAAFTRKRAREALEHVSSLVVKEKLKKKEFLLLSTEVSGSGNVNVGGFEKNRKGGSGNSGMVVAVAEKNRNGNQGGVDRVDSSSEVLAALNAVELKEKERLQGGFKSQNAVSEGPSNGMTMDVENERLQMSSVSNIGKDNSNGNKNERAGDSVHLDSNNAQGEKMSNVVVSIPPVDQLQYVQNNHATEENIASQD